MENEETIHAYFRCLNDEDWGGLGELFHEDAALRAVGARPRRGPEEIVAYFGRIFEPWARHQDRPTRILVVADTVLAEVTFTGIAHGAEAEVSFDAVDVFDLEGGRIRRMSNWYDIAYARKALGG